MARRIDLEAVLAAIPDAPLAIAVSVAPDGAPAASAISWIVRGPGRTIDIAVGSHARLLANCRARPDVALVLFLPPDVVTLSGVAREVEEALPGLPVPLCRVRLAVRDAFSAMFTGGELRSAPTYIKRYPVKLSGLDAAVSHALGRCAGCRGSPAAPPGAEPPSRGAPDVPRQGGRGLVRMPAGRAGRPTS